MGGQKIQNPTKNFMSESLWFYGLASCLKLLLIPAYRSTDFEVHRHWLATTHSLPLSRWYLDETSPWTLDYPPFFAYFEYILSLFAHLLDHQIVDLHEGLNYASNTAIYFQRISVIFCDLVLLLGAYRLIRNLEPTKRHLIWVLVIWSPGLMIVDHIHFQYNGFLLGILLLSVSYLKEGKDLMGGFLFAVLLCFKHLFAVAAPVYFVYLLRHYCWGRRLVRNFGRLSVMGAVVLVVFAAAYGPFVYYGQMQQVIRRMFPFGRGLCHAYWAPNFWVFYIVLDKGLALLLRKLGFYIQAPAASFTGGLVGDLSPFVVLPKVTPLTTLTIVLLAISPCLFKLWRDPRPGMIPRCVSYAYTCGFLFGWHVHEKGSLHFVIPLAIVAGDSLKDARHYFMLSVVSCYSLFPLLFEPQEYPVKVLLLLLHAILMWLCFSAQFSGKADGKLEVPAKEHVDELEFKGSSDAHSDERGFGIGWIGKSYLLGILVVELWGQFLQPYLLGDKLPFLPLVMTSIYCALGMMYSWIWQLTRILNSP
ncbi:dolichyl pyrophosphate Glc1Man9GlcNAc2 alpha-1 3-glucosyltransferase [Tripterygium wilfordii]|uniref:Alpha-1,3-glucosyltransferase n=1 Tax=Tripterygium wilfordii TaxID=458696 RepID=A0A7J7CFY9_TRIWF|nr:probable dolichyl pyrophosphate Glc1Man9GlcNAc2 alpha-1,3-glucosyltransferase [Tripterygium wilfordii]XP_038681842.1 probable dolichyl pyrophosphate Glc1Man9GlcNAc2 alpha-1,3-glucosyltransferase [Tripterygium wilfordii]XP_038681843.1 probable dolichyl pyrophosphate Glc1Man9GlcNAc2 alpha-1,3-glucosyltransferase [Tripterygium wilfordii]KAF5732837.1 dolichyl pyrophosphate Glc1Man9GlcNAc2 alpha-1 3-glucosyltransferase [Tripterygium wilfordii]